MSEPGGNEMSGEREKPVGVRTDGSIVYIPERHPSQWTRRPDDPRWYWEIRFGGGLDEPVVMKSGHGDGPGLNVLDEVVRELPGLIYHAEEEPNEITINLSSTPFR